MRNIPILQGKDQKFCYKKIYNLERRRTGISCKIHMGKICDRLNWFFQDNMLDSMAGSVVKGWDSLRRSQAQDWAIHFGQDYMYICTHVCIHMYVF